MQRGARRAAVDRAPGLLRAAGHDRPALQRVPAALRRHAARRWRPSLVEARKNGARIPWSYWHDKPLTGRGVPGAPMISDPICRYDCDIPVDGVAAFVFTSAERAQDLPNQPVYVSGYASGTPTTRGCRCTGRSTTSWAWARNGPAALGSAGVGPGEVDLPQLYDGFSPFVYFWLEVLGLCPVGRGAPFRAGRRHRQRPPGGAAGAVRRRRARQRAHARRAADARVLPPAVRTGRRAPARNGPPSAWPAIRRRTTAAPSSTAPEPF